MLNYTNATELLEQGRTKDAYAAFLSIVELSIQQLHSVKFVHQTIVSKPTEYESSIQLLKSSVDQLEKITIQYMPGANNGLVKKSPPPLPPKPSKITKPTIPPRPAQHDTQRNRSRGNSVSFAKEPNIIEVIKEEEVMFDDDDDDDMEIDFHVSSSVKPIKEDFSTVLSETVVDPSHLVPAQTNTRDSLALPSSSSSNDYIPNIPSPPLLATHRRLQQQLNERNDPNTRQSLEKVRTLYMSAMTIPSILQFSPRLIAYQLTLIESAIFRSIPGHALVSHSARTPHKKIVASTDFFNFITRSIEHSILLPQEASRRAELIYRWIKIATYLASLHNYQTLKAVVSALGTPPIQRLRRTWDCIPKKRMARLDLLTSLMSESDNYRKYRDHMQGNFQPVVPFFGVFLHDMTYLKAANDTRVQEVLQALEAYQRTPEYPPQPPSSFLVPKKNALHFGSSNKKNQPMEHEQQLVMQYVLMRPWVSEKTIDTLSLLREPAKPRSVSSPTASRFSMEHRMSTGSSSTDGSPMTSYSSSPINHGILSNASSFMRFNMHSDDEKKSIVGGFWPFRKSSDMSRNSEEDDEEEEEYEMNKNRHARSLSLPSKDFEFIA